VLRAWIEVDDRGRVTDAGYSGGGMIGSSTLKLGALKYRFQAVITKQEHRQQEHLTGSCKALTSRFI